MMRALRGNDVHTVELEQGSLHPFDDLILRKDRPARDEWKQIKSSNYVSTTIDEDWLTTAEGPKSKSPLRRMFDLWEGGGSQIEPNRARLSLVVNRSLDPKHPLLGIVDRYTGEFSRDKIRQSGPKTKIGLQLKEWSTHLGQTEDQVVAFLSDLLVEISASESELRTAASAEMAALGLKHDLGAVAIGVDAVRDTLKRGKLVLTLSEIAEMTRRIGLRESPIQQVTTPEQALSADAVIRGPIRHLGLTPRIDEATALLSDDPGSAAAIYGEIAELLEASPYAPHGTLLRRRQVRALREAGKPVEATAIAMRGMVNALLTGDVFETIEPGRDIDRAELPEDLRRSVDIVTAVGNYEFLAGGELDELALTLKAIQPSDPFALEASVLFAEHAGFGGRSDLVLDASGPFENLTSRVSSRPDTQLLQARLVCCVADAKNSWPSAAMDARSKFSPDFAPLFHARYGRFLAENGDGETAVGRYLDAIERGAQTEVHGDVADWLYALRLVRLRYGLTPRSDPWDEEHDLALAFRGQGSRSLLPEALSSRERALTKLTSEALPDALKYLRRYSRRAYALGAWADEAESHEMLARTYRAADEPARAIPHLVAVGQPKELTKLVPELPEAPLSRPFVSGRQQWERAASYELIGSAADLVPDDEAQAWVGASLDEIIRDEEVPLFAVNPVLSAWKAFAALALLATREQAEQFVTFAAPLAPRDANHYRSTDDAHVEALISIAQCHDDLAAAAVGQLCELLVSETTLGRRILSKGWTVLSAHRDTVAAHLEDAVKSGNVIAARAVSASGAHPELVRPIAEQLLARAVTKIVHVAGVHSYRDGWSDESDLVTVLGPQAVARFAGAMCRIARDKRDVAPNRRLALEALIPIGGSLADAQRHSCYKVALMAGRGVLDGSAGDELAGGGGQLDRFRFNFGPRSLRVSGLRAGAALARTSDETDEIRGLALLALSGADAAAASSLAQALSWLPPSGGPELRLLAANSLAPVRALGSFLWSRLPGEAPEIGEQLASDAAPAVRRTLARHLDPQDPRGEVRDMLLKDVRRSVRLALAT